MENLKISSIRIKVMFGEEEGAVTCVRKCVSISATMYRKLLLKLTYLAGTGDLDPQYEDQSLESHCIETHFELIYLCKYLLESDERTAHLK